MILSSTSPYALFQLLVATKTKPFFVVVPIISDHACSFIPRGPGYYNLGH